MRGDHPWHKGGELERRQRHDGRSELPAKSAGDELRPDNPGPSEGGQSAHEEKQEARHHATDQ